MSQRSRLTGDWDMVTMNLRKMKGGSFLDKMTKAFSKLGDAIEDTAKNHIKGQDLKFVSLSDRQVERKGGRDEFFIDSGFYVNNISVKVQKKGKRLRMVVGPNDVVHPPSGQTLGNIAKWLEFGTSSGIPARPLWRKTRREVNNLDEFEQLKKVIKESVLG